MKKIPPSLGRLALFLLVASGLAVAWNRFNHPRYWHRTIQAVQTTEFNILSHTLPTKLSILLQQGKEEELQQTLDSSYGLFGLVVTDCQKNTADCPNQEILYATQSNRRWREQLTLKNLKQHPYDKLLSPPPLTTQGSYERPYNTERNATVPTNQGDVIGRVYYVRGTPPGFWEGMGWWLEDLAKLNFLGLAHPYTASAITCLLGGTLAWANGEKQKRPQGKLAELQQQNFQHQLESKNQKIAQLENQRNQLQQEQQKQQQYSEQLEQEKTQVNSRVERQEAELNETYQKLEELQQDLGELSEQQKDTTETVKQREDQIASLQQAIQQQKARRSTYLEQLKYREEAIAEAKQKQSEAQLQVEEGNQAIHALRQQLESQNQKVQGYAEELGECKKIGKDLWLQQEKLEYNLGQLQDEKIRLEDELGDAYNNIDALSRQFHTSTPSQNTPSQELQPERNFQNILAALKAAEKEFEDILIVWNNAKHKAKGFKLGDPQLSQSTYKALAAVAELGHKYFQSLQEGTSIGNWKDFFNKKGFSYSSHESKATLNKYGKHRISLNGQKNQKMVKHITIPQGDKCIQIYFEPNKESRRIDIGYCAEHLPYCDGN
jgi:predicted  nucleic acid-binding Zn-ribbon protein